MVTDPDQEAGPEFYGFRTAFHFPVSGNADPQDGSHIFRGQAVLLPQIAKVLAEIQIPFVHTVRSLYNIFDVYINNTFDVCQYIFFVVDS